MKRRDDLLVGPREKAIEAVKAGNKEEALKYIEELDQFFKPLHDRYIGWIEFLLDLIAERLGEETVKEALRGIGTDIYGSWLTTFKTLSSEEIARAYCMANRVHHSDVYCEEDDEKFAVVTTYCGSGGKVQKDAKSRTTTKAYPWSFNRKGINYYCCHCPIHTEVFEEGGLKRVKVEYGQQFDKKGKPTGESCRYIIYKGKPEGKA